MAKNARERIADRTELADERLKEQGFLGRIGNRIGLATANTMDRLGMGSGGNTSSFMGGTIVGALKGAVVGTLVWGLLFGLGAPLAGLGAFMLVAGGTAAAGGVVYGQKALEKHSAKRKTSLPDHVAQVTGAIPNKRLENPITEQDNDKARDDHAARELARRRQAAAGAAQQQHHGHHHH